MQIVSWLRILTSCVMLLGLSGNPGWAWDTDAYYAKRIWTGEGKPIEDGVLVVVDGKITAVGPRTSTPVPTAASRHELGNQVLIPGLVIAQSHLADDGKDVDYTISPDNLAIDGFDFFADYTDALSGGVTTVQIAPGSSRLIPGMGAVVKLGPGGAEQRTIRRIESLRIALDSSTRNPPTIYQPPVGPVSEDRPLLPTSPQFSTLPGALAGIRNLLGATQADNRFVTTATDPAVESIEQHLSRGGIVRITAVKPAEIRGALQLAGEFGFRIVLVDPQDLTGFAAQLDDWPNRVRGVVLRGRRAGVFTNPTPEDSRLPEPWESAAELIAAGLPVAVRPDSDADLRDMLFVAGQFQQGDLSPEQALAAVTRWPAELVGVDQRVGTLAQGKDADFVVLNDDPFAPRSYVAATYVDGQRVFHRPTQGATVIRAAAIHTGDGTVLPDASLVIQGRTIRGLGGDVSAPLDAEVRDFGDAVVVPGFVDLGTGLGIGGALSGNLPIQTKLGEQLFADDPAIDIARTGGVTTVLFGMLNSSQPTPLVAFKLGTDARVVADPVAIRFRLTDNLPSAVPTMRRTLQRGKEYHESWVRYEQELAEYEAKQAAQPAAEPAAKADKPEADPKKGEGEEKKEAEGTDKPAQDPEKPGAEKPGENPGDRSQQDNEQSKPGEEEEKKDDSDKAPEKPQLREELEPYRALFAGKIPAFVEARQVDGIKAALALFREEFNLRTVLVGCDDLARRHDLLEGQQVAVCAGPQMLVAVDSQRTNLPQLLANQQIPFGFQSEAASGSGQLRSVVQLAVSQGLGPNDALQALTSVPAAILAQEASFGTIGSGKDADLVVLSGPPFELSTRILAVMVDGQWVYERESQ